MNKKIIAENLEQLIEEHKKEKIPYKAYEFDNASYTLLLIDINQLIKQLEEKDKIIEEAKEYLIKLGKQPDADLYYCINEHKEDQKLLEILERGKNGKS